MKCCVSPKSANPTRSTCRRNSSKLTLLRYKQGVIAAFAGVTDAVGAAR
jgi:hypothetical protein